MSHDWGDIMRFIQILELTQSSVLGGAIPGEVVLAPLISRLRSLIPCEVVVIDFCGIEIATSSFLRTSVIAFRQVCLDQYPSVAILFANMNDCVRDELSFVLHSQGDAVVSCEVRDNVVSNSVVLGKLEEMQFMTLTAVLEHGQPVDARTLAEAFKDISPGEGKRFTKWNNRLSQLTRRGILREESSGRVKFYTPIVKGLKNGA